MKAEHAYRADAQVASGTHFRYWKRVERPAGWWPWGWLPVAGLAATFIYGLLVTAPEIQAHTTAQVAERLADAGIDVLDVRGDGQRVLVRAMAGELDAAQIGDIAADANCRTWLRDNAVCPNRVDVELVAAPTAPVAAAEVAVGPAVSAALPIVTARPHRFTFQRGPEGVTLTGEVPDEATRNAIFAEAKTKFDSVDDRMQISGDEATETLDWALARALPALAALDAGVVEWRGSQLSVRGSATDERANLMRESLQTGRTELLGSIELETYLGASRCNAEFAALLDATTIRFATSSAALLPDNQVFLSRIAQLAQQCARPLVVSGHTDDRGPAEFNLDLSRARAEAVVAALIAQGVPATQLTARGYGETKPVADNTTVAGRTANRRIEIVASRDD